MAHPAVQEFDALLQSLQTLKPPGVNKPKVDTATKICMELQNIPIEPQFVDSLVSAFRKSPDSHKLGVLYIIDSIMRQWVVTGAAHAGGVRRMTDSMPTLMNDFIPVVPEAQKDRLSKLLDIWTSSKTFPAGMLADFRNRLANPQAHVAPQQPPTQLPVDPASLLAALNAPPPQQIQQTPAAPPHPPSISNNAVLAALQNFAPPTASNAQVTGNIPLSFPQSNAPMNFPPQPNPVVPQQQTPVAAQLPFNAPSQQPNNLNALAALLPNAQAGAQDPNALISQLQLLQTLSQSLGPEGLRTILSAIGGQQQAATNQTPAYPSAPVAAPPPNVAQYPSQNGQFYGRDDTGSGARERSRSPDWNRRRYSPPNRRDSPTYGVYDPHKTNDSRGQDDRGRRGNRRGGAASSGFRNEYRQRSPQPATRESPIPHNDAPKPIGYDNKLQDGRIKVLSRTLFVGGVKTSEADLKNFFRQYGGVQSCIVNHEKRHAFLKLISHQDAMATRQSVWNLPESEYRGLFERVNWAVGFGPTHCADYNIGVSVIPMDLLTDADRKWLLTAEYGGTGGKQIQTGMVVEEPDIEIGTGPSSKAIHRRGGGNQQSGRSGNFTSRRGGGGVASPDHSGRNQNRGYNRPEAPLVPEPNTIGPPPAVPTFGAPIPGFPFNIR